MIQLLLTALYETEVSRYWKDFKDKRGDRPIFTFGMVLSFRQLLFSYYLIIKISAGTWAQQGHSQEGDLLYLAGNASKMIPKHVNALKKALLPLSNILNRALAALYVF